MYLDMAALGRKRTSGPDRPQGRMAMSATDPKRTCRTPYASSTGNVSDIISQRQCIARVAFQTGRLAAYKSAGVNARFQAVWPLSPAGECGGLRR